MIQKRIFLLTFGLLCTCNQLNNPKIIVHKYFQKIYSFNFIPIRSIAYGNALLEAAYVEGMISEMDKEQKLKLFNPEITVEIEKQSHDLCKAKVTLKFPSGEIKTNVVTLKRKKFRWFAESLKYPLAHEVIYEYQE